MNSGRCSLHCDAHQRCTRRDFLRGSTVLLAGPALLSGCASLLQQNVVTKPIRPCGPAAKYIPTIKAAFVRRKEDYGMWWPGAIYVVLHLFLPGRAGSVNPLSQECILISKYFLTTPMFLVPMLVGVGVPVRILG